MFAAILALSGAFVYGAADFLGGLAARRLRALVVTAVSAASGLVLLCVAYPVFGGTWNARDIGWGAVAGIFGALAVALLYACLAVGPMSILSPLTAVVSAIAPMLWVLLVGGETLPALGFAGLGVALVAVVLVGFIPGQHTVRPTLRGVLMAIGAGLSIGAFLIAIDQSGADSGLVPLIVSRATNVLVMVAVLGVLAVVAASRATSAAPVPVPVPVPAASPAASTALRQAWTFAIACGLVDAAANVMLLLALRAGDLSIVAALTAMYPAGTILLAALVLRERIAAVQWVGLVLALAAGAMLAIA